jgi:hypothetical protein
MPTTITKTNKTAQTSKNPGIKPLAVNYRESSIVLKTIRMAETLKKFPRPTK